MVARSSLWFVLAGLFFLNFGSEAVARIGVCGDRQLPNGRIRHLRNLRLECGSAVSHYVRTPMPFDIRAWRMAELRDDRVKMQAVGQKQALIEWSGSLVYPTIEAWEWTDWVYGADPVCGYDTKTHTRTVTRNGKTETETYTTQEMRSCWHDEARSEARHCSSETMKFKAGFVRPALTDWNPKTEGYYDVLPNKYDLLPGEVEDVQIFSNGGQSTTIRPSSDIGDPWNEYGYAVNIAGHGASAPCAFNKTYELDVRITTNKRLQKRGPNAFRRPIDQFGREIESLEWNVAPNPKAGEPEIRALPRKMRLTDSSEVIIAALSRQTREYEAEIEKAKDDAGEAGNVTKSETRKFEQQAGFWKDTYVRIKLYMIEPYARDVRVAQRLYLRGADVNEEGQYHIELVSSDPKKDMYRASGPFVESFWNNFKVNLEPGRPHEFYVSMFNKGVPFYAQDCEDAKYKTHWNCRLGLRGEDSWYSKELPIPFMTDRGYDARGWLETLNDFQGKPLWRKVSDLFR